MCARISSMVLAGFLLVFVDGLSQTVAAQTNKEIVQRVIEEIWNQGNLAVADELFAADFVNHDPVSRPDITDLETYKAWVLENRVAFPDYHVEVHDMIGEGDKVVARCTVTGTHQGTFLGVAATGKEMTMTMGNMHRLVDGQIVEAWWGYDLLGLMQQIYYPWEPSQVPGMQRKGDDFLWGEPSGVTGDPGDPEANKALVVRELEEIWNPDYIDALSEELLDELFSADFVNHDIFWPGTRDAESHRRWLLGIRHGESLGVTMDMIAEGDKVAGYWTGGEGRYQGIRIYRFADGKIVELWWVWDQLLEAVRQGVLPPPPEWVPSSVESRTWGQVKALFREYTDTP